jgi:ADP-heptose:LPS heptosyltransferase
MKRILIFHNASLGDTIVALPSFKLIRKTFASSSIYLLTVKHEHIKAIQAEAILANTNLIDGYIFLEANYKKFSQISKLRSEIHHFDPEVLIYLNEPRNLLKLIRDYLMFKIFGINNIIGLEFLKKNRDVKEFENGLHENISQFLGRKVQSLGPIDFTDPSNFDLHLTNTEDSKAHQMLSRLNNEFPIIGISIGTKFPSNNWGDDLWESFLFELANKFPSHNLVAIGTSDEFNRTQCLLRPWANRSLNLCGILAIRESAAILSRCSIFIGHDSGPIHLSASVNVPCVGIYGSRNLPGIWFPSGKSHQIIYQKIECQGCQLSTCYDKKNQCIRSITPSNTLTAVEKILSS